MMFSETVTTETTPECLSFTLHPPDESPRAANLRSIFNQYGHLEDPRSRGCSAWCIYVLDQVDQKPAKIEEIFRKELPPLVSCLLVNDFNGMLLKDPVLANRLTWERGVYEKCKQHVTLEEAVPHEFCKALVGWARDYLDNRPVDPSEGTSITLYEGELPISLEELNDPAAYHFLFKQMQQHEKNRGFVEKGIYREWRFSNKIETLKEELEASMQESLDREEEMKAHLADLEKDYEEIGALKEEDLRVRETIIENKKRELEKSIAEEAEKRKTASEAIKKLEEKSKEQIQALRKEKETIESSLVAAKEENRVEIRSVRKEIETGSSQVLEKMTKLSAENRALQDLVTIAEKRSGDAAIRVIELERALGTVQSNLEATEGSLNRLRKRNKNRIL